MVNQSQQQDFEDVRLVVARECRVSPDEITADMKVLGLRRTNFVIGQLLAGVVDAIPFTDQYRDALDETDVDWANPVLEKDPDDVTVADVVAAYCNAKKLHMKNVEDSESGDDKPERRVA